MRIGESHRGRAAATAALAILGSASGGCVQDALADGLYGGVTDTIAGIISGVVLGLLGLA